MRRLVLLSVFVPCLAACAAGEGVPDGPIFTTTTANDDSVDTDAETGDGDAGDGDGDSGDGDGDGDSGDGDGDGDDSGDGDGDPTGGDEVCGNDVREGDEECDGNDVAGLDCTDFGFQNGALVCADDCTLFTNACSTCGDGQLAVTEVCDGSNFGGKTCVELGYASGTLSCAADCSAIIETGCMSAPTCGNGVIDGGEACDGGNLNGQTCQSLGFDGGSLSCTAGCQVETGNCTIAQCLPMFSECDVFLGNCCETLTCVPFFGCMPE